MRLASTLLSCQKRLCRGTWTSIPTFPAVSRDLLKQKVCTDQSLIMPKINKCSWKITCQTKNQKNLNLNRKRQSTEANTLTQVLESSEKDFQVLELKNTVSLSPSKTEPAKLTSWGFSGLAASLGLAQTMLFLRFVFPGGESSWHRSGLFNTDRMAGLHGEVESNSLPRLPFGKIHKTSIIYRQYS